MILLICILFNILAILLIYKATKNIFSIGFLLVMQWIILEIGALYFYMEGNELTLFYTSLTAICLGIGIILANLYKHFSPSTELYAYRKLTLTYPFSKNIYRNSIMAFSIYVITIIIYLFYSKGIPMFQSDIGVAKQQLAFNSGLSIRALKSFVPILLMIWYTYDKKFNNKFSRLIFYFILILSIIFTIFYGNKSSILSLVVVLIVISAYFEKKVTFVKLIIFGFSAIIGGILIVRLTDPTLNIFEALEILYIRASKVNAMTFNYIIYNYVPQRGYTYGWNFLLELKGFLSTLGVFKGEYDTFGTILFNIMNKNNIAKFAMTSTLPGEFYVSFGWIGLIFGMVLFGFVIQLIYINTIRKFKDIFLLSIMCYLQLIMLDMFSIGDLFAVLNDRGLSLLFTFIIIIIIGIFFNLPKGKIIIFRRYKIKTQL